MGWGGYSPNWLRSNRLTDGGHGRNTHSLQILKHGYGERDEEQNSCTIGSPDDFQASNRKRTDLMVGN